MKGSFKESKLGVHRHKEQQAPTSSKERISAPCLQRLSLWYILLNLRDDEIKKKTFKEKKASAILPLHFSLWNIHIASHLLLSVLRGSSLCLTKELKKKKKVLKKRLCKHLSVQRCRSSPALLLAQTCRGKEYQSLSINVNGFVILQHSSNERGRISHLISWVFHAMHF